MAKSEFNHFRNTRHERWTIIGVVGEDSDSGDVDTVEIFAEDANEPIFTIAVPDIPQFIAGLVASTIPGDLTKE
ncbi:hypothetical protein [Plantibacter sp. RU18]|uniref:hypothetical protein n=1 Tax=Plantibacter sp. RU18 TaxID=3158143 RepID=UPI002C12BC5A|nr:hypothetical protein [Gemmatimonadaceae bacterium]